MLYIGLATSGWTRYCSPNSKYWRGFFSPGPSSSNLTFTQVARLTTEHTFLGSFHDWNMLCLPSTDNPGCRNTIGQTGSGRVTQTKTETDVLARKAHFQRWITDCSIVFKINKYVNLACFLLSCKHMVFVCFSRVKNLHTAPLKGS